MPPLNGENRLGIPDLSMPLAAKARFQGDLASSSGNMQVSCLKELVQGRKHHKSPLFTGVSCQSKDF